jgi:Tfp pilus assembly protein PilP
MRLALILVAALAASACSKSDDASVQRDLRDTGHDLAAATNKVRNDPDIRQAGEDARQTAADAATGLKKAGAEAKAQAEDAAAKAKVDAHQAAGQARGSVDRLSDNRSGG